jgi:hypothetical protein
MNQVATESVKAMDVKLTGQVGHARRAALESS